VFLTLGLTAIPAIVLGHSARREVRATGERGLITVVATRHGIPQGGVGHPVPGNPGGPFKPFVDHPQKPFIAN